MRLSLSLTLYSSFLPREGEERESGNRGRLGNDDAGKRRSRRGRRSFIEVFSSGLYSLRLSLMQKQEEEKEKGEREDSMKEEEQDMEHRKERNDK